MENPSSQISTDQEQLLKKYNDSLQRRVGLIAVMQEVREALQLDYDKLHDDFQRQEAQHQSASSVINTKTLAHELLKLAHSDHTSQKQLIQTCRLRLNQLQYLENELEKVEDTLLEIEAEMSKLGIDEAALLAYLQKIGVIAPAEK